MRMDDYLENTVKLPGGARIEINGFSYGNVIVREFGGLDEEEISKPKYRANLALIQEEAISRCIAGLVDDKGSRVDDANNLPKAQHLRKLPMPVLDFLLLEIRAVTMGETYKRTQKCPHTECGKLIEPELILQDLRDELKTVDFSEKEVILERGVLKDGTRLSKVKVRPINGELRLKYLNNVSKDLNDFGANNTELLLHCIVDIDGTAPTIELVRTMKKADRTKIFEAIGKAKTFSTKREFICPFCSKEFILDLDLMDFLF